MKLTSRIGSAIALGLTIVPSFLVLAGTITWQLHADLMTAGMIIWFVTAPVWMKKSQA
jgi:hypothetical protein